MSSFSGPVRPLGAVSEFFGGSVQPLPETRCCWVWCYEIANEWCDLGLPLDAAVQLWLVTQLRWDAVPPMIVHSDNLAFGLPGADLINSECTSQNSLGSEAGRGAP